MKQVQDNTGRPGYLQLTILPMLFGNYVNIKNSFNFKNSNLRDKWRNSDQLTCVEKTSDT